MYTLRNRYSKCIVDYSFWPNKSYFGTNQNVWPFKSHIAIKSYFNNCVYQHPLFKIWLLLKKHIKIVIFNFLNRYTSANKNFWIPSLTQTLVVSCQLESYETVTSIWSVRVDACTVVASIGHTLTLVQVWSNMGYNILYTYKNHDD